jgi:dynamin-like GTPase MGM1, mitochondrial
MLGLDKTRDEATEAWATLMQSLASTISPKDGSSGGGSGDGSGRHGGPNGDKEPPRQSKVGMGVAIGAAAPAMADSDGEGGTETITAADPSMLALTKEMIEIRRILQKVGKSSAVTLPSIVVIGSQSSGKSSVLEAIVGHDFLPKGINMVTRRPIELTLVNTPDATVDYAEFPDLQSGRITDFTAIRKKLTDLNQVPDSVCVSDEPIQLRIYSRNVPDLALIDLPGYIQVEDVDQPRELRQNIAQLCEKYIKSPNIILAVSAADVDLANSTALQASRRVDPRGDRTIGVLTKMDLVEAERGIALLRHNRYPLRLGYVGVVTKAPPQSHSLFKKGPDNLFSAVARNEAAFFSSYPEQFGPASGVTTGTTKLRHQLTMVLSGTLSANMKTTRDAIERDLRETSYRFKARYGDRMISAESYVSAALDDFKHNLRDFRNQWGQQQLYDLVKTKLDDKVVDVMAKLYWNPPLLDLSVHQGDPMLVPLSRDSKDYPGAEYLESQLAAAVDTFVGGGVGEMSAARLEQYLRLKCHLMVDQTQFRANDNARKLILAQTEAILKERHHAAADGVELAIKPYKYGVRVKDEDWQKSRQHMVKLLNLELKEIADCRKTHEAKVGDGRKLRDLTSFIRKVRRGDDTVDNEAAAVSGAGGFTSELLETGRCFLPYP